jgi:hypothetical protein
MKGTVIHTFHRTMLLVTSFEPGLELKLVIMIAHAPKFDDCRHLYLTLFFKWVSTTPTVKSTATTVY